MIPDTSFFFIIRIVLIHCKFSQKIRLEKYHFKSNGQFFFLKLASCDKYYFSIFSTISIFFSSFAQCLDVNVHKEFDRNKVMLQSMGHFCKISILQNNGILN